MSRPSSISHRPSTGHHGSDVPPYSGGGGGGGRGGGRDSGDSLPNYGERLRRARLALAIFITPICMLFLTFSVAYLLRRGFVNADIANDRYVQSWIPVKLPWLVMLANSVILLLSSVTMDLARRSITRECALEPVRHIPGVTLGDERHAPWLAQTTILGFLFLGGQVYAWRDLSFHGFHLMGGTSSSFIYMLTAMHGLHLAGGLLALLFANGAALLHRPVESRRIVVDVSAWYWHFLTGLWFYILVLFYFAAQ
jgi:cytochrome c oxidase subunit III